jgi:hypothetical protein
MMAYNRFRGSPVWRDSWLHYYDSPPVEKIKVPDSIAAPPPQVDETLSETESLSKLTKACEGCTGDESCCAIVGLKKAGWTVTISQGIAHDGRKGFVISCTEPEKKSE